MSGKRYAVLIGNASFPGENPGDVPRLPPLHCPAADVAGLRQILEADSHGGYIVTPLIDRPHSEARRAVYDRLKQAGPEDQVVIYYSGHGKLDPGGNLYLAGRDTDPESLNSTAFAAADIQKYVAESRAAARIVILDCCFSGAVDRTFLRGASKGDIADQAKQAVRGLDGRGIFYLTASTDTQTAEEKELDQYSLLTKHIIEGIRDGKADADDDGLIGFSELCRYVQEKIRLEGAQRPLSFILKGYGDPAIALTGRPALAAKRDAVEQEIYSLRQRKMLDGDDVVRILDNIHRSSAAADGASTGQALLETLYAARSDTAQFLKIAHRFILGPQQRSQYAVISEAPPKPKKAKGSITRNQNKPGPPLQLLVSLWNRRAVRIILALSVVGCSVAIVSAIYQNHQPAEATQQTGPTSLVRPGVSLIK